MNKSTIRAILATAAVMILLFKVATRFNLLDTNTKSKSSRKQQSKQNKPNRSHTAEYLTNTKNNSQNTDEAIAHNNAEAKNLHLLDHDRKLILTKHAKCRMECRHFTEAEVQEILDNGKINFEKSNDRAGDCPTYALEGETSDGQEARMVFAFCDYNTAKVITVIDLDTDWQCNCY
jgi:hypothetical protein